MSTPAETALAIAKSLIHCPSVTPSDAGALDALGEFLSVAGFSCNRLTFSEEGTPDVDNLVARIGTGAPHLCFAGHTDVVPPGDESLWSHDPFSADIADGRLYGRGASDMKGAVACFAAAAIDYVATCGGEIPGTISLLITGDEEGPAINGTKKVLSWMEAENLVPDHCLVGEPSNPEFLGETIKIGRRGSLTGHLTVTGQQGHVAYPNLAANPVKGIVTALAKLYETKLDSGSTHFSPSNLEVTSIDVGNSATNIIPARAEAHFNIRFNDNHDAEKLKAMLMEKIGAVFHDTRLSFTLDFAPHGDAFVTKPGALDKLLSEAVTALTGKTPVLSTSGGTSDARFIKDYCPVLEFGLTSETIHKVDENATLDDLEVLTAIYRRFIAAYFETFGDRSIGDADAR
ncbi:MAG: succinyl-diaminopimelate desuccinylase [Methyloceanibacter sp.]|jgi:succinyl-diaminopimelate desuccinylase